MIARAEAVRAVGGEVWVGDETAVREFPPLRCAWARRGQQAVVTITGRNGRRVVHGALNVATGEVVRLVRERGRGEDVAALVAALGARRPGVRKVLVWDNAPPHHTKLARNTAAAAGVELAWLPVRSPELNPCEDLWRHLKRVVAANRVYPTLDDLAARAVAWLDSLTGDDVRRLAGLTAFKFGWLSTYSGSHWH